MSAYLPSPHNLLGAAGLALALMLFAVLGAAASARREQPEIALVAGWGLVCLVLTTWGVITSAPLRIPLVVLAVAGVACLARPMCRQRIGSLRGAGRLLLLSLPMWLVMLPLRPSQIDTWLNLLPNAAYLFDFDMFPTALRPPSYSFLPVAPYNTQFAAYIASVVSSGASVASGGLADGAMALFSIALQCAAALLLARVVAGRDGTPPWWACAAGLLLAVPLNPGFVPRVSFASYGEAPLAVTSLFAVWLSVALIEELAHDTATPRSAQGLAHDAARPRSAPALALVLAALVNIKQSGIGLLLPIGATLLALVLTHPRIRRGRGVGAVLATLVPGLVLYLLWRVFVVTSGFVAGELEPLPFAAWNFPLLPQIFASIARAIFEKATFFLCLAAVLLAWVPAFRRDRWSRESLLLGMIAGVTVLFNGFLVFTYVAHFPPGMAAQAHSYFRYSTQLSLLVMLGLAVALRPAVARWVIRQGRLAGRAGVAAIAVILVLPVALVRSLRFDLEPPQPTLWQLGHQAARDISPEDRVPAGEASAGGVSARGAPAGQAPDGGAPSRRLALLVPGDTDDAVGSMLRGVLMFTPPRRPGLDIRTETKADAPTLDALAAAGYRLALVTCTPSGLDGIPTHVAAMLRFGDGGWRVLDAWPYPDWLTHTHFAALLAREPLCATGSPN